MVKNIRIYMFLVVGFCFFSCIDQKLYLQSMENPRYLKMDGVFLLQDDLTDTTTSYCDFFLLYENSVLMRGMVDKEMLERDLEATIHKYGQSTLAWSKRFKRAKLGYGVYKIVQDSICLEFWEPSSGGPLRTLVWKGKILDSTSFMIDKSKSNYKSKKFIHGKPVIYVFYPMTRKPDSTMRHIRKKEM